MTEEIDETDFRLSMLLLLSTVGHLLQFVSHLNTTSVGSMKVERIHCDVAAAIASTFQDGIALIKHIIDETLAGVQSCGVAKWLSATQDGHVDRWTGGAGGAPIAEQD
jgi:hypothetical protein